MLWTKCVSPQKTCMLKFYPPVRWYREVEPLGGDEVRRVGGAFLIRINALIRETTQSSPVPAPSEMAKKKMAFCEAGRGSFPHTESSGTLTLNLPVARTLRNGFLLLSHPVDGTLLQQPEHTETVVSTTFPPYPQKCLACSDH